MGGQATNSGIDYQQRVAAWCLINQYSEFNISDYFDQIEEELIIQKSLFETSNPIDDLNLQCTSGRNVYLQIKRSISLAERETGEFYKTIDQFVQEFLKNEGSRDYFGLITTSDASGKITGDLKKIVASIKLNPDSFSDNPMTESEKDTLSKFRSVFDASFKSHQGRVATDDLFIQFTKRVFVAIIDVESGFTLELASLMLLKSKGFSKPELIWSVLIKNSLVYASNRLSVDKEKLDEIFGKYIDNKNDSDADPIDELLVTEIITQGKFSVGKEVLIIESFIEEYDYMIVELYRFKDDCSIKCKFSSDKITIESGEEWKIIQRFSSMKGMERYIEENKEFFFDKRVVLIPANEIDTVDETECAELHKSHIDALLKNNETILNCLHCGKTVDQGAIIVEIQDEETIAAVGLVHKSCIRPIDRIMGTILIPDDKRNDFLKTFDYKLWVKLMMKGQGLLNSLKASPQMLAGRTAVVSWNSGEEYDTDYSYCIKFNLEDGSSSYAYQRSRIERLNKASAEHQLQVFEAGMARQKKANDPYCVLSMSKTSALYSQLLTMKRPDEDILEITSVEIAKYSLQIAKLFDKDLFHYAPMCLVRDKEEETIVNLSNVVPIISDPLRIEEHYKNWVDRGFELDEIELKIIKSDKDFDNYMRMIFDDGFTPIIDPLFDKNFKLVKGYPVNEYRRMMDQGEE